jgi:uncharacterized protein (UPF0276 family)
MPPRAGIGLRAPHYAEAWQRRPPLALVEVHSENFFGEGGQPLAWLERFASAYPLSLHGVGLSLGSTDALDERHLERLEALVRRFQPALVSEHLSWSSAGARHANDLLPLPFTREALDHVVGRIGRVQERLGRRILVENISSYVAFPESALAEWEFVSEAVRRSGCGLLLDVNNIWVNASNHGYDPRAWLEAVDGERVEEIHLGGHEAADALLVDTHGARVAPPVWTLYRETIERLGPKPTVIEWDTSLPPLDVLLDEARRADEVLA